MKIIFMGTPLFAVPVLEMLVQSHHEVLCVVTQPDKPVGRKKILEHSPVKTLALKHNIPVFQPKRLKQSYQELLDLKADLIVTAAYGQMLPNALIDHYPSINVHGSLLPEYRGGAPIQYALFDGKEKTGVTIMYMAYQMDSGDMIKQGTVLIDEKDDYVTLAKKLSLLGTKLLEETLTLFELNKVETHVQDASKVTFAYTLKRSDEYIQFEWTKEKIINRIRGLAPNGATFSFEGNDIKVYQAKIIDDSTNYQIGEIVEAKKRLVIQTSNGLLELLEIQVPGKKRMFVKDFLNGQNVFVAHKIIK